METCVRGFSYMPDSKLDPNLQYIESDELQRAWKVTRRQRQKEQEQRIWEDFVKEQDIVNNAYKEDPYQFLHGLPENCLKELMEAEFNKMKKDTDEEAVKGVMEQQNQGEGDHSTEKAAVHMVTFAEDDEKPDMFHIFDDENDVNLSGGEDDQQDSPSTVRERCSDDGGRLPSPDRVLDETDADQKGAVSTKSSENVSNVIESSIYCARIKDARIKLGEEMVAIMASLEVQDVMSVDRVEVSRRCRRAAEFCTRFNRIYMYQLQRQVHNIKRHVSQSLPLAQHTHFQAQMLRVLSLHQNMLQAFQVFHKSFSATSCLRECARALSGMCAFVRDASALCRAVPPPKHFQAASDLFQDELLETCDKLDGAVGQYELRVAHFLSMSDVTAPPAQQAPPSGSSSTRSKKSRKSSNNKNPTKTWSTKDTDARLSMYSLDTLRINLHPKPSTSRENHSSSGTSKGRASPSAVTVNKPAPPPGKGADRHAKRMIRRPLMRAPQPAAPRHRPHRRDTDVPTMVEAVDTCESPHALSRGASPAPPLSPNTSPRQNTPRPCTPPQHASCSSPQHASRSPRKHAGRSLRHHASRSPRQRSPRSQKTSPVCKQRTATSTKVRSPFTSPRLAPIEKSPTPVSSETPTTVTNKTQIAPVTKIQCATKQSQNDKSLERPTKNSEGTKNLDKIFDRSGKNSDRSRNLERHTDRSGKSTDRRSFDRGIARAATSTDRSRKLEKSTDRSDINTDRSKNEKTSKSSPKSRESGNRKGGKVDKNKAEKRAENIVDGDGGADVGIHFGGNDKIDTEVIYGKLDRPGHIGNPGKEDNNSREFCGVKELTDNDNDYSKCYAREVDEERIEREKNMSSKSPTRCDVTRLLRQLCSGDPAGLNTERVTGAKNAQLLCIRGGSPPRQPSTPQLLRILEETIQKQSPRPPYVKARNPERYRLNFNIPETTANRMFQYRTKFVQHMLTSPLYANSAVGKPWEMIGSVSDKIIDELLTNVAKEMEISRVMRDLYKSETN